jgi:glucosamine 6-phosphate synthetase-like amidotransferase/phosphosugar isomerase protein
MCGIVGILGREPVTGSLVDALKRLEYRGYDSVGIATLENGQLARRRAEGELHNLEVRLARDPLAGAIRKGNYRHFMAKEIHEQREVIGHTLAHYLDMATEQVRLPGDLPFDFRTLERVSISACGTAHYAGLVAKYWFERFVFQRLGVQVEQALVDNPTRFKSLNRANSRRWCA